MVREILTRDERSIRMKLLIGLFLIIAAFTPTSTQDRRIKKLEGSLMAPCCYSQTIDQHMSGEAAQMRDEVSNMVMTGKTDEEILTYYKDKYGKTILAVPDGTSAIFAFGVPVSAAIVAVIFTFMITRSLYKRSAVAHYSQSAPPEMLERVRRDMSESL
jgi:cytochrome c-type biogenesis protein CcmH